MDRVSITLDGENWERSNFEKKDEESGFAHLNTEMPIRHTMENAE